MLRSSLGLVWRGASMATRADCITSDIDNQAINGALVRKTDSGRDVPNGRDAQTALQIEIACGEGGPVRLEDWLRVNMLIAC